MPITVIPADDRGSDREGLGLSLLAQAQENAKLRRERQTADYADLVKFLSNPNTSEEEQNAVLTMDPKAFQSKYGVPITSVGKDVQTFRDKASDTPAARKYAAESGAPMDKKRILVEHPGGTAQEQQQAATLAQTQENVAAEQQKRKYYEQAVLLNQQQGMIELSNARQAVKKNFRTLDGRIPTLNETNANLRGDLDLNPTTEASTKLEMIRTIFDGDENDPAFRYLQLSLLNDSDMSTAQLEKLRAETEAIKAHQIEQEERNRLLQSNTDPDTGKSLSGDQAVDPGKIVQVSKAFDEAMTNALGPLGAPSRMTTIPAKGFGSIPPITRWTQRTQEYPGLTEAIFGNGVADPAAVRADLMRVAGDKRTATSVKIPVFDKKTGLPGEATMPIDQAVVAITQMRRQLATSLPPLFKAMEGVSPRSLIEITQGNPIVLQAARAYAPTLAKAIDDARAQMATKMTADAAAAAVAADPNTAPLAAKVDELQKEVDATRRLISGQANPAPTPRPGEMPER